MRDKSIFCYFLCFALVTGCQQLEDNFSMEDYQLFDKYSSDETFLTQISPPEEHKPRNLNLFDRFVDFFSEEDEENPDFFDDFDIDS